MADPTAKALIVGQSGCGKTTLIRTLSASYDRVIHWDSEDEYRGELVTFADLPLVFKRRAFRVVYRPRYAQRPEDLAQEFEGLASLLLACGNIHVLLTVDEARDVLPTRGTGGLGILLRKCRKRGVSLLYATQYATEMPRIIGASRSFYLFHTDDDGDHRVLKRKIPTDQLQRVAALPPHEYIFVRK